MGPGEWISAAALLVASIALGTNFLRGARVQGTDLQRIKTLEDKVGVLASNESVQGVRGRVDELERAMGQLETAVAKVAVVEAKLDALDRLMSDRLAGIAETLRRIEDRSFDPVPRPPARRPGS